MQVNKLLKLKVEIDTRDDEEYKVEVICDCEVYMKEIISQLIRLHYLLS